MEKTNFKYLIGFLGANFYRFLRVFPNSDPLMGFILPAAKNTEWWKAPLFAFASMVGFSYLINSVGPWTWVTATTYALIALGFHFFLKNKKSTLKLFISSGLIGVLIFDLITGPIMSSFLFNQSFLITTIMQVPFTIMHLISVVFGIVIISPFYDAALMKEISQMVSSVKNTYKNFRLQL
ncbi:MAG: hypothetical protein NUV57_00630 [archaeon]|nr:hypothetical protein [archaeon]